MSAATKARRRERQGDHVWYCRGGTGATDPCNCPPDWFGDDAPPAPDPVVPHMHARSDDELRNLLRIAESGEHGPDTPDSLRASRVIRAELERRVEARRPKVPDDAPTPTILLVYVCAKCHSAPGDDEYGIQDKELHWNPDAGEWWCWSCFPYERRREPMSESWEDHAARRGLAAATETVPGRPRTPQDGDEAPRRPQAPSSEPGGLLGRAPRDLVDHFAGRMMREGNPGDPGDRRDACSACGREMSVHHLYEGRRCRSCLLDDVGNNPDEDGGLGLP